MTATVFTESKHPAAFIVSEADAYYSRDQITIGQSQTIVAGQVLGRVGVVANMSASTAADASNTGNGTIAMDGTAPIRADAKDGDYVINFTSATAFEVVDPAGKIVGKGATGTVFNGPIKFTITAGGTAFVADDVIRVTVLRRDGTDDQFVALNLSATDGSAVAAAIAIYPAVTASGETQNIAGLRRHAQVRGVDITWPAGITANQIAEATNQLASKGIIVR